jgi:hypothetical protein
VKMVWIPKANIWALFYIPRLLNGVLAGKLHIFFEDVLPHKAIRSRIFDSSVAPNSEVRIDVTMLLLVFLLAWWSYEMWSNTFQIPIMDVNVRPQSVTFHLSLHLFSIWQQLSLLAVRIIKLSSRKRLIRRLFTWLVPSPRGLLSATILPPVRSRQCANWTEFQNAEWGMSGMRAGGGEGGRGVVRHWMECMNFFHPPTVRMINKSILYE